MRVYHDRLSLRAYWHCHCRRITAARRTICTHGQRSGPRVFLTEVVSRGPPWLNLINNVIVNMYARTYAYLKKKYVYNFPRNMTSGDG